MAEPLSRACRRPIGLGLLLWSLACTATGHAETLPDPTRPPDLLGAGRNDDAAAASGPVLQSVLIAPGRREAIISGKTVRPGDKFGDARVVRIVESEVVLRNGKSLLTLKIFPGIEKRLSSGGNAGHQRQ